MYNKQKKNSSPLLKILGIIIITYGIYQAYVEFYNHQWRYITLSDKQVEKYTINSFQSLKLYQLMKDTHEILVKHDITYWIEGGTLLGAVRHKGVIPFDDDLDIAIMQIDEAKLQDNLQDFRDLGYQVIFKDFYSICDKICLDIFVFRQKDQNIIHANLTTLARFPNDYFATDELFPLKKYQFGKIQVFGPQNFKNNLDRNYPEWDKYAVIQQPHGLHISLSPIEQKTKLILTPKLLQPAMPVGPLKDRITPKIAN